MAEEGNEDDAFTEEIIKGAAGSLFAGKDIPITRCPPSDYPQ
jgi:hypothetical protein